MAALDTFLARLLPRALGCADPVARQALLDTAIDFCEGTHVVQVVTDPMAAVINQPDYTPVLSAGTSVVSVKKAWFGSQPLYPASDEMIANVLAYDTVADATRAVGTPFNYFWHEEKVWVYPLPEANKALALTFRVAIKPTHTATTIPDELLINWREAIVDGALERVLGMRGTNHYDPKEADLAGGRYQGAVNRAKAMGRVGRAGGELTVRMRPFA